MKNEEKETKAKKVLSKAAPDPRKLKNDPAYNAGLQKFKVFNFEHAHGGLGDMSHLSNNIKHAAGTSGIRPVNMDAASGGFNHPFDHSLIKHKKQLKNEEDTEE